MEDYVPPYSLVKTATLHLPLLNQTTLFQIVYEEDFVVYQTGHKVHAEEMCNAMNTAHKVGYIDGSKKIG